MSEDVSFWVTLTEKIVALLIIALGGVMIYFTATTAVLGAFTGLFGFFCAVLLVAGAFLLIMKPNAE
ncbi:MAG: hypothetical protein NWF04_06945 [Candidatus Bathyarchaeota archaeon]|nr:hypothetical protein [Candidatus Bathyarchaeota archaeon]